MAENDYEDIPGTTVFDARRARKGYQLNMFCYSLMKPENRAAFRADEEVYLKRYPMTEAQRLAVLARDWNWLIAEGGNIYFLTKLFFTDEKSYLHVAAEMTGMSQEDFARMMLAGGRPIEGNRSKAEQQDLG